MLSIRCTWSFGRWSSGEALLEGQAGAKIGGGAQSIVGKLQGGEETSRERQGSERGASVRRLQVKSARDNSLALWPRVLVRGVLQSREKLLSTL